jgi:uncharacterized protein (DUF608 family)
MAADKQEKMMNEKTPYSSRILNAAKGQKTYRGKNLLQIALPLGGIGAGCICLNGQGGLQDFSIHNKPSLKAVPDRFQVDSSAFALLHLPDLQLTRLVEGPMPVERIYDQGLKSHGNQGGRYEGLPPFQLCSFKGEYPFGQVQLSDPEIPLVVQVNGFSPFIPLDDMNSSIPCAILEYTLKNPTEEEVRYEFSYHLSHLACGKNPRQSLSSRNALIENTGVFMYNEEHPHSEEYGSAALGILECTPEIKGMWFRSTGWFDAVSTIWREVTNGAFKPNDGSQAKTCKGLNGGSVLVKGVLAPGQEVTYPIVITWYFPNVHFCIGTEKETQLPEEGGCCCQSTPSDQVPAPCWRPYYTSQWGDAREVLLYVKENYSSLRGRTQAFHDALFSSTLPSYVIEAITANLAIIKSPTVLRQENGNLWGWEGCCFDVGCCFGSCTHVWNYAQSIPHLFPQLERTLREQELVRSMNKDGHVTFRAALPDGPTPHDFHAAADGQLGGILKAYREWQINGDKEWLKKMYPLVKKSLDFCIENWDPRHTGLIEEPHHNTYDIEFWGPEGMSSSCYLAALAAIINLSHEVGHPEYVAFYDELLKRGAAAIDTELFNGQYYEQKVMTTELRSAPSAAQLQKLYEENTEEAELYSMEGPKFQFGRGCLSDGVLGAWLAIMCGVEYPQSAENISKHLKSVFENNFKASLRNHPNPQRAGYAMGDEPGLLLCTWPSGGKPTLPFVYSDEVWTGIEYQVASHLIINNMVEEGLTIVYAARSRYDGHKRNPWNEYECGNYYARAMSSYALLAALSGFRYSAPEKTLYFGPKTKKGIFKTFFSAATGWGTISLRNGKLSIRLVEGTLAVETIVLTVEGKNIEFNPNVVIHENSRAIFDVLEG